MSRRLIKTSAGEGLYSIKDEWGDRLVWESLPPLAPVDPASQLEAERTVKVQSIGGLYADERQRERDRRRRAADDALEAAGVKPRSW